MCERATTQIFEWALSSVVLALRVAALSCVFLVSFGFPAAHAIENPALENLEGEKLRTGERYFIDFHARDGGSYLVGHIFTVYGRLNAHGIIVNAQVVGFSPDSDRNPMALFVPMPGLFGRQKDDLRKVSDAVYRRYLTVAEFHQLSAKVRQVQATHPTWNLLFYNCNNFVSEISESIGLHSPIGLMLPTAYVAWLRALNDT